MQDLKIFWFGFIASVALAVLGIPYIVYSFLSDSSATFAVDCLYSGVEILVGVATIFLIRRFFEKDDLVLMQLIMIGLSLLTAGLSVARYIDPGSEDFLVGAGLVVAIAYAIVLMIFSIRAMTLKSVLQPYWKIYCVINIVTACFCFSIIFIFLAVPAIMVASIFLALSFNNAIKAIE
ncbi:MAG: hypothetical protein MJY78_11285 [Fibrobacter sp.]|nr:hypothetical protein [Fibrobacter sp.]